MTTPSDDANRRAEDRLVQRIRVRDPGALDELREIFSEGVRFLLRRRLRSAYLGNLDEKVHDIFVSVVNGIVAGRLSAPLTLTAFVHGIVKRRIAVYVRAAVNLRPRSAEPGPAQLASNAAPLAEDGRTESEHTAIALAVLRSLPLLDRDVLTRFYLNRASPESICHDLRLSETRFRLITARARDRFYALLRNPPAGGCAAAIAAPPKIGPSSSRDEIASCRRAAS